MTRHAISGQAFCLSFMLLFAGCTLSVYAQPVDVTAEVDLIHLGKHESPINPSNVVIWLTPLQGAPVELVPSRPQGYTLIQKDKQFSPHILVVPVGSSVDFPNLDPFFHNVFSLFNGKRFDLGLYESHTHRSVQFDREGISFIFCNIHPDMGAVIVSLATPYFALSTSDGHILLRNVPSGSYRLNVWAENVAAESLNKLSRTVSISAQNSQLGKIKLEASGDVMAHHQNKFGESYGPIMTEPY